MVIDLQSQYNAILGLTAQSSLGIVASVPHQKIKFNTPKGVACIKNEPEKFLKAVGEERKKKKAAAEPGPTILPGESSQGKEKVQKKDLIGVLSFHSTKIDLKMSRKMKREAPIEGGMLTTE